MRKNSTFEPGDGTALATDAWQVNYVAWAAALLDALRDAATAEALQAIVDLDLSELEGINVARQST